jgi:hypothetical protein
MVNEIALPTRDELMVQEASALSSYRKAVRRELSRARKHRPTGTRRSLQARIVADLILVSILSAHIREVEDVIAEKK